MQFTMKAAAAVCAVIMAVTALSPTAFAYSYPWVDDVNDCGKGKVLTTVHVCGKEKAYQFRAKDMNTGKAAKVKILKCRECNRKHICNIVMKLGHNYTIKVRSKIDGKWTKWRAIGYCVY